MFFLIGRALHPRWNNRVQEELNLIPSAARQLYDLKAIAYTVSGDSVIFGADVFGHLLRRVKILDAIFAKHTRCVLVCQEPLVEPKLLQLLDHVKFNLVLLADHSDDRTVKSILLHKAVWWVEQVGSSWVCGH